ncbi:MAG TPA: hypothetical protein VFW87_19835 [Pirellulales bacterium]|nr:hypothetical protein [Pirellulales bacterium]
MSISTQEAISRQTVAPLAPWGRLPPRLTALYVTSQRHPVEALRELLVCDSAMRVELQTALLAPAGLARMREASFDAVLVHHDPPALDALEFAEALRGAGGEDPLVILGAASEGALAPLCHEAGADGYLSLADISPRHLIGMLARAVEWHRLIRDNRRLAQLERQRLRLEHGEAERLLREQRELIRDLEELGDDAPALAAAPPDDTALLVPIASELVSQYRDLLRAYVIMGSGNLAGEIETLAARITAAGLTASKVMQLHVYVLEELLRGLGNRGVRHVMSRADLLILELMMHLAQRTGTPGLKKPGPR